MGGAETCGYMDEYSDMSKPIKLRGFGDPEVTERLKSRIEEDAMQRIWMALGDPMVEPWRVLEPVMRQIGIRLNG